LKGENVHQIRASQAFYATSPQSPFYPWALFADYRLRHYATYKMLLEQYTVFQNARCRTFCNNYQLLTEFKNYFAVKNINELSEK